jgi:hypothetical protein
MEASCREHTPVSLRQDEQQARAEAQQCREEKARLQAEYRGLCLSLKPCQRSAWFAATQSSEAGSRYCLQTLQKARRCPAPSWRRRLCARSARPAAWSPAVAWSSVRSSFSIGFSLERISLTSFALNRFSRSELRFNTRFIVSLRAMGSTPAALHAATSAEMTPSVSTVVSRAHVGNVRGSQPGLVGVMGPCPAAAGEH